MTQPEMVRASILAEVHHDVYPRRHDLPKRSGMRPARIRRMPAMRVSRKRYVGRWS